MKYIFLILLFQLAEASSAEYTFGVVPQFEVRELYAIWKPVLNELSNRTGDTFKMVGTESISAFERAFNQGKYDFAYMNPWHSLIAYEKQGYIPLVRDDSRALKGILVVRKDSGINEISQLEGADIAFPSPNALGASLLMRADLKQRYGINIHPIYVDTHSSVYINVVLKQTIAGGGVLRSLEKQDPMVQNLLKILYTTRSIKSHPISAHPRVPKEVINKVIQAFIFMGKDSKVKQLLAKIPMVKPVKAEVNDYTPIKEWGLENFYVHD